MKLNFGVVRSFVADAASTSLDASKRAAVGAVASVGMGTIYAAQGTIVAAEYGKKQVDSYLDVLDKKADAAADWLIARQNARKQSK